MRSSRFLLLHLLKLGPPQEFPIRVFKTKGTVTSYLKGYQEISPLHLMKITNDETTKLNCLLEATMAAV